MRDGDLLDKEEIVALPFIGLRAVESVDVYLTIRANDCEEVLLAIFEVDADLHISDDCLQGVQC